LYFHGIDAMQIIANGLITGLTTALLALGFSVVYLPARAFHLALGGIFALVPYIVLSCSSRGWPAWLAVSISLLLGIILSLGCELLNHAPLERRRASPDIHLISSLGIYILLVACVSLIWGSETKVLRTGVDATIKMGSMVFTYSQVAAAMVSIAVLAAFYLWLRFSDLGLQLRALADNPTEFALRGYSVNRSRLIAFAISGVLGTVSSLLVAYDVGFDPQGGLSAVLLAVVAMIIGSKRSFFGPVIGALLLGLVRSQVVWFLSARWQDAVTFVFLALFLYVRPHGILGHKQRLEVTE
jgi:branched-chain amino acid transport system permease protein